MKNISIIILILLILGSMALLFTAFQVRETESALVVRFGDPIRIITEPGLKFKWPPPIEQAYKFDNRMRTFKANLGETPTKGAVPVVVNTFIVWRIEDPLKFFTSVGTVSQAETRLLSQLSDSQNKVIGRHDFSEFVNSDPGKIKIEQIQQEMLEDISGNVSHNYGIKVETLGIRQLKISEEVSKDVFDRMRAERNRMTEMIMSQGQAEAARIRAEADSKRSELLAAAEARAKAIRGQGDAEAARYYRMLEADPQLAMFLRDIDALKKILEKRSTIVLSADSEPFKLIKSMPNLQLADQPSDPNQVATK